MAAELVPFSTSLVANPMTNAYCTESAKLQTRHAYIISSGDGLGQDFPRTRRRDCGTRDRSRVRFSSPESQPHSLRKRSLGHAPFPCTFLFFVFFFFVLKKQENSDPVLHLKMERPKVGPRSPFHPPIYLNHSVRIGSVVSNRPSCSVVLDSSHPFCLSPLLLKSDSLICCCFLAMLALPSATFLFYFWGGRGVNFIFIFFSTCFITW